MVWLQKQNFSRKRQAILQALQSTNSHPTADWVYHSLKDSFPDLSLGTVYRNLARFKQQGLILSIGTVNGQEHFDGNIAPHAHFICKRCGNVVDIDNSFENADAVKLLKNLYNFDVLEQRLIFYGYCNRCAC